MGYVVSEKIGNPAHRAGPQHLNLYQQAIQRILWIFEFWVLRCNCNFLAIHIIWFNFSHDWWQLGENFQFSCHLFQLLKSETVCGPMGFPPFASSNGTENYLTVTMILVSLFQAAIYLRVEKMNPPKILVSSNISGGQEFRSADQICLVLIGRVGSAPHMSGEK